MARRARQTTAEVILRLFEDTDESSLDDADEYIPGEEDVSEREVVD